MLTPMCYNCCSLKQGHEDHETHVAAALLQADGLQGLKCHSLRGHRACSSPRTHWLAVQTAGHVKVPILDN
jgi:hypothetical protein